MSDSQVNIAEKPLIIKKNMDIDNTQLLRLQLRVNVPLRLQLRVNVPLKGVFANVPLSFYL